MKTLPLWFVLENTSGQPLKSHTLYAPHEGLPCFMMLAFCCHASVLVTFNSCPFCFLFYWLSLRVASGPRVKLASRKSVLNPRWFTLLTVLRRWSRCFSFSLLLCGLFYEAICFMSYLVLFCYVFSPFSIAITSLREERAYLSAFHTFVRFVLVWFCRFPLPLGVWEGLQFLIVALPGLFSYPF